MRTVVSPPSLISTKLCPPRSSLEHVGRPRIADAVGGERPLRLAMVVAPAGYGKSTELIQWHDSLARAKVSCGWVSLDSDDNDPIRFLSYIMAAFTSPVGHQADGVLTSAISGFMPSADHVLPEMVKAFEECDRPLALFLDDYHKITSPDVHRALDWLIAKAPASMRFFIASRTSLPLSLSTLRLRGQLVELRVDELSFRPSEAAHFINGCHALNLKSSEIEALCRRTEGWAAGLQLASLALSQQPDRARFVSEFSGSDRDITDYLGEVVLSQQPDDIRQFMLQTSMLDRMCAALCSEITGRTDCQRILEDIEQRNLFFFPLDRERRWFRYHHLISDFLRGRATRNSAEPASNTCAIASRWFEANGFAAEAIHYAFTGNDKPRAADLVAKCAEELVQNRGEHATLLAWLKHLPSDMIEARPRIRLANAWATLFTHHFDEAEAELDRLLAYCERHGEAGESNLDAVEEIRSKAEMMKCVLPALTGDFQRCRRVSAQWLARWTDAPLLHRGITDCALGHSCLGTAEYDLARRALADACRCFEQVEGYYGIAWANSILGMICMRQGALGEAITVYRHGLDSIASALGLRSNAGTMISLLLAEAMYERNELEETDRLLEAGTIFLREHGSLHMTQIGYSVQARLRFCQGRTAEALALLTEGEALGRQLNQPRLSLYIIRLRVELLLRSGDPAEARRLAEISGFFDTTIDKDIYREIVKPVQIRLWLSEGDHGRALAAIRGQIPDMRKAGRTRRLIALLCLAARAEQQLGREASALRSLDEALRLAAPEGFIRTIVDEGGELGRLIAEMLDKRPNIPSPAEDIVPRQYLQNLVDACGIKLDRPRKAESEETGIPIEGLTPREVQMLEMIEAGMSNSELGKTLYISEQTVKWHLHNLYSKLDVRNRTRAVARAKQLGLF